MSFGRRRVFNGGAPTENAPTNHSMIVGFQAAQSSSISLLMQAQTQPDALMSYGRRRVSNGVAHTDNAPTNHSMIVGFQAAQSSSFSLLLKAKTQPEG